MRFIGQPDIAMLYKETDIRLHVDNRDRGDIIKQIQKINDLESEYSLEIKKKKKSGDVSGYIWALINKIAEKKGREPYSIYAELLTDKTEPFILKVNPKNYAAFKLEWEGRGQGYQIIKSVDYVEYVKCKCIRGLSGMNDAEKTNFAEEIKKECKLLGISIEDQNERVHKAV